MKKNRGMKWLSPQPLLSFCSTSVTKSSGISFFLPWQHWWNMVESDVHWKKNGNSKLVMVSRTQIIYISNLKQNEIYSFSPKICFFSSAVNSTSSGKLNNYFLLSAFDFNFSWYFVRKIVWRRKKKLINAFCFSC